MAEATATEERVTTPESTTQNPPAGVDPTKTAGEVTTGGGEITIPAATDAQPDGTDGEAGEFKLEDLKEWQEAFKEGIPSGEAGTAKLPGKTLEEFEAAERTHRDQRYRWLLGDSKPVVLQKLQDDLGLGKEAAESVWNHFITPITNELHASNDHYNFSVLDEMIRGALPEAEAKLFFDRKYANRSERMQALVAIGRDQERREWQEKVKKGEYVLGSAVKKIGEAAYAAGRGKGENGASASQSGNNPATTGSSSGLNYESWLAMTPSERRSLGTPENNRMLAEALKRRK